MRLRKDRTVVLVSPQDAEIVAKLSDMGVETILTEPISELIEYERFHADMQVLMMGTTAFVCGNSRYLKEKLRELSINYKLCEVISGKYPDNVAFNAALVGDKLICKASALSVHLKEYCSENNIKLIDTKQGYAKCSVLAVDSNSVITADRNIYQKAVSNGIDALLIRPGFITLNGADYGFIGGASGVIGDKVIFFGDVYKHPDGESIVRFIESKGQKIITLTNNQLIDIGGFVRLI